MTIASEISKGRLLGIDALRGIAAFMVVIYHVFGGAGIFNLWLSGEKLSFGTLPYFIPAVGYAGVYLFFVISGFCIHLRFAKSRAGNKQDSRNVNFFAFWKRRWIRLYPAYLAAMVLFLLWEYRLGKLTFDGLFVWDVISHVLLIHNLDNRTVYSMNGVFWTLAIEEQLYLLYFLMLALRAKWGWKLTIAISFSARFLWLATSLIVTKLVGFELPFNEGALANWWIWILGAIAVESYFGLVEFPSWCQSRLLAVVFLILAGTIHFLGAATAVGSLFTYTAFVFEPLLWGAGFFGLINYVTSLESRLKSASRGFQIVSGAAFVGLFSYSLYLIHELVIQPMVDMNRFLTCFACLITAYVFYLIFERPSILSLATRKQDRGMIIVSS